MGHRLREAHVELVLYVEDAVNIPWRIPELLTDRRDAQVRLLPGAYRQASAAKGHMGGPLPQR